MLDTAEAAPVPPALAAAASQLASAQRQAEDTGARLAKADEAHGWVRARLD